MTFLNPLALIGLLAASIPIIIHLLNLRKLKVIEFSSLMFLKELQKNKIRKVKIKQLILLILRVLAVIFLVTAFSRPAFKSLSIAGLGSEIKSTTIILFDNSLSMSISDRKGSYLQQAKNKAFEVLNNTKPGDDIYFIPFSEVNSDLNKLPKIKPLIESVIRKTELSFNTANIESAIIAASKISEKSKNLIKEVYIISDLQKSGFSDEPVNLNNIFNSNTSLTFVEVGKKNPVNCSIDSVEILDKIFEVGKLINTSVVISNQTTEQVSNLVSDLYLQNKKVGQKSTDVPDLQSRRIQLSGKPDTRGYISGKIEIEEDEFQFDNVYYLNFYIPEKIKILISSNDPESSQFIRTALSQSYSESENMFNEISETVQASLNSYNFNQYDVLILIGNDENKDNAKLLEFIKNGGKVVIFPGEKTIPGNFNNFTSTLGFQNMQGVFGRLNDAGSYVRFGNIDYSHPVFKNIFIDQKKKNIESPNINYCFNYKADERTKSLIDLQNGYSFLLEKDIEKGKVLVFTSGASLSWSNFALKGIFLPMLFRINQYLSTKEDYTEKYYTNKDYSISFPKSVQSSIRIEYPDGREKIINLIVNRYSNELKGFNFEIPGHYKFFENEKLIKQISVNIDPRESDLIKSDNNEIKIFLNKISENAVSKIIKEDQNITEALNSGRKGTELWKVFVVLALICLLAEMVIARVSGKDLIIKSN